jgi:hypothetical protein
MLLTHMPFCGFCGEQINVGDRFCSFCGEAIESCVTSPLLPQNNTEIRWINKILGFSADYYVNLQGAGQQVSKASKQLNTGLSVVGALMKQHLMLN